MLVLDEPTNDLDIETLEILEDLLMAYRGTVILVSHDREFINNLTTITLVLEGDGSVKEYTDGYESWLVEWDNRKQTLEKGKQVAGTQHAKIRQVIKTKKMSYKDKELLKTLPETIEALETEQAKIQMEMAKNSFYEQPRSEIDKVTERNEQINSLLEEAYEKWQELDERA